MLKKILMAIWTLFLIAAICVSIANFISVEEANAFGIKGSWEYYPDGSKYCMGSGEQCDIINPNRI